MPCGISLFDFFITGNRLVSSNQLHNTIYQTVLSTVIYETVSWEMGIKKNIHTQKKPCLFQKQKEYSPLYEIDKKPDRMHFHELSLPCRPSQEP